MNKRIAEMMGFQYKQVPVRDIMFEETDILWRWIYPGYQDKEPPNFQHSMDACEKWLVPWLKDRGDIDVEFLFRIECICEITIWLGPDEVIEELKGIGPSMSEALCNASLSLAQDNEKGTDNG